MHGQKETPARTTRHPDRGARTARTETCQAAGKAPKRGTPPSTPRTGGEGGRGSPAYTSSNVAGDLGGLNEEHGGEPHKKATPAARREPEADARPRRRGRELSEPGKGTAGGTGGIENKMRVMATTGFGNYWGD